MLGATGYYWYSQTSYTRTRAQVATLQTATAFPPTLNGLKLQVRGLSQVSELSGQDGESSKMKLLIVTSDDCAACQQMVPKWRDFMSKGFRGEVWLIAATGGTHIVNELWPVMQAHHQAGRLFQVRQAQEFQLNSGIMTTPSMVLLDSDDRVRLVTNRLDDESLLGLSPYVRSE